MIPTCGDCLLKEHKLHASLKSTEICNIGQKQISQNWVCLIGKLLVGLQSPILHKTRKMLGNS